MNTNAPAQQGLRLYRNIVDGKAVEALDGRTLDAVCPSDGQPFARRGSYKEAPVDVRQLPPHVGKAFIAIEDRRFYHHIGIDPIGSPLGIRFNLGYSRYEPHTFAKQFVNNENAQLMNAERARIDNAVGPFTHLR